MSNPPVYIEDGTAFPQVGELVTSDGEVSGENPDITVDAVKQDIIFGLVTTADLTAAHKPGVECSVGGDSGGPWIVHEGSTNSVHVAGTDVAHIAHYRGTTAYCMSAATSRSAVS
jgi:hypothetical protein